MFIGWIRKESSGVRWGRGVRKKMQEVRHVKKMDGLGSSTRLKRRQLLLHYVEKDK